MDEARKEGRLVRLGRTCFRLRSFPPLVLLPVTLLLGGTLPVPVRGRVASGVFEVLCLGIAMVGIAIRGGATAYAAPGTSGRQREKFWAGRLNTSGLYSVVRNPLYLGNLLCWTGVALATGSLAVAGTMVAVFLAIYLPIILAEEAYLESRFGDEFLSWTRRTPRLVPRPALWRSPDFAFNWKRVLKKEPDSVMALIGAFSAVVVYRDSLLARAFTVGTGRVALLFAVGIVWLALRALKKWTRLFSEPKWKAPGTELDLRP